MIKALLVAVSVAAAVYTESHAADVVHGSMTAKVAVGAVCAIPALIAVAMEWRENRRATVAAGAAPRRGTFGGRR